MDVVLAIDQGTTNTKVVAVNAAGRVVGQASTPASLSFPRAGWAESDPLTLWHSVTDAAIACLAAAPGAHVASIAVTSQRESVVIWDRRTGEPLGPCVSWQCRRTTEMCESLRARGLRSLIESRSGLAIDPMFSATKARWLLDSIDSGMIRAERGKVCVGTVDSWLAWNLSGGRSFVTDHTNASRTQLMSLDRLVWDDDLLEAFGVPKPALPEIRPSSSFFGHTRGLGWLPDGTPIHALIGDSHAALFGHGAPAPPCVKATYGTGTSVMAPVTGRVQVPGLSSTIAWSVLRADGSVEVVHAMEGNIYATGAAIEWMATILGLDGHPERVVDLAATVETTEGVVFVPAFAGLGAPHWDARARGLIAGATRATTQAHFARAAIEAVAYQVRDIIEPLVAALGHPISAVYADGGAIQADLVAQTQANVLNVPVLRSSSATLSAIGAAYLAGMACGMWRDVDEIRALPRSVERFEPQDTETLADQGYRDWLIGLRRTRENPDR